LALDGGIYVAVLVNMHKALGCRNAYIKLQIITVDVYGWLKNIHIYNIIHKNMKVDLYINNTHIYTRKQQTNQSTFLSMSSSR
jgi:hypothetical protein